MVVVTDHSLVKIYAIWGLGNKDRSECHFSSYECYGTNVYDKTFDPNPVANQKAMMVSKLFARQSILDIEVLYSF
jgi:hypothetical protein